MEKIELTAQTHPALEAIGRYMLRDGMDLVADFNRSQGSHLFDAKRGDYFLDLFSCYATVPLGYNHPRLTSREAIDELGWCAVQKPSNSDVYTEQMARFVTTMGRVAMPQFMKYMFFIEGGALAVENGLKTAFDWKVRKNMAAGKGVRGHKVIHFRQAFHGRSGYTLSLTNTADPRKTQYYPIFDWPRIPNPKCTFPLEGANLEKVQQEEVLATEAIKTVLQQDGDDVACLIIEPIQSEGGDNHFRPEFHHELRRICDEHDILLIYDEVQTGFGPTGQMWACHHYARPDIICFGKKTQVCGIFVSSRIDDIEDHVFRVSSRINSTWGGNLTDMTRCRMYLEVFEEEDTLAHVRRVGQVLLDGLAGLEKEFPLLVSNIRGLGLMCAFDLPNQALRSQLRKRLFENRVIILGCGERSIRFRTALNIPEEDIWKALELLRKSLQEL